MRKKFYLWQQRKPIVFNDAMTQCIRLDYMHLLNEYEKLHIEIKQLPRKAYQEGYAACAADLKSNVRFIDECLAWQKSNIRKTINE